MSAEPRRFPIVGVGAVVRDQEGRILLIQRGRPPGQGLWAVPGGKPEFGEELEAAVTREVREETGLEVKVGDVAWVGEIIEGEVHIVLIDYWAELISGTARFGDDAVGLCWATPDEARAMALTPTMHDMLDTLHL